jgi:hypothetical protein
LADYWGVWEQLPTLHDERGTSLILLHSEKAIEIWDALCPEMKLSTVSAATALRENPSAITSSQRPASRDAFFARYHSEDFHQLINILCPLPTAPVAPSLLQRLLRKLNRIFK